MMQVMFTGPVGHVDGLYQPGEEQGAPAALILHGDPRLGSSMRAPVPHCLSEAFVQQGYATLRINFRGVGHSQGEFDGGQGELADAASALNWLQQAAPDISSEFWIAGYGFGAWVAMQLLMRRPELVGFISVAPPANMYDFTFLSPCPTPGLVVNGLADQVALPKSVRQLVSFLQKQKRIQVEHRQIRSANHLFTQRLENLKKAIRTYIRKRAKEKKITPPIRKRGSSRHKTRS